MYDTKNFLKNMLRKGFYPFVCVPCSAFKGLIACLEDCYSEYYYPVNNEGEAVAISVGLYLNGKNPVVMVQNSGIGNMLDPITSLLHVYEIPLVFFTSWRGEPNIKDEKQHVEMGKITKSIYSLINISSIDLVHSGKFRMEFIIEKIEEEISENHSVNLLLNKKIFKYEKYEKINNHNKITTHSALKVILSALDEKEKIVSSTGYLSRELYYLRQSQNNFYMVGSMGCAISIGVGLAMSQNERVVVLDGDGAVLMRLEGMVSAGYYCSNLLHIIFKNNMYESTGGQENLAINIEFDKIAIGCGYKKVSFCENEIELLNVLNENEMKEGPQLVVVKVEKNLEILSRPNLKYEEIRDLFRKKV